MSRAQRSMSETNGALQTPISGLPEIGAQTRASRVNPTCVDRYRPWRSRISGAPFRALSCGAGVDLSAHAPRCTASGTRARPPPSHGLGEGAIDVGQRLVLLSR